MMRFLLPAAAAGVLFPALATSQVPDLYDPAVYREFRLTFAQANWWTLLLQNYAPEIDIPADFTVDGKVYKNVGVRFRGNTSYTQLPPGSEKKCFNIQLDSFVAGQDIYGYDHLNLNNGFHDPSFMREFLGYWVCRRHGLAPKANFVKLYLNNVYWGVYLNVQQPNKDMMKEWFRSNDGNRYRGFPTSGTFGGGRCALTWLGSVVSSYLSAYQAKQGDGTDLMQLCNVLNNTPSAQLQATLPAIFSVDQFYRYAACMNVMTNTDSYIGSGKDHFVYHDEIYGAFHMFPFDLNETLAGSTTLSPTYNNTTATYPAFAKTLVFADWNQRYLAHYRSVFQDTVNWNHLGPIVTKYHTMIAADVAADTKKIYTTQQFHDNLTLTVSTANGNIPGLKPLIDARYAFLSGHALFQAPRPTLANLKHAPAVPTPVDPVTVTAQVSSNAATVQLWYRAVGPFVSTPMFDDGQHGDGQAGDGVWGVVLAPAAPGSLVDYYVDARTAAGTTSYEPSTAELRAPYFRVEWPTGNSPIKINEFVAQNLTGIVDENNQHEDWLELYNSSNQPVVVGGMYLTDNQIQATKWLIPSGTTIPAYGTLLVWCDEDGLQGPMHANFKLSTSGEELALFATDGKTRLDYFAFGLQQPDVATGRFYDADLPWVSLPAPTPRAANQLQVAGARAYTALLATNHSVAFGITGTPKIGTAPQLDASNGPAAGTALVLLAVRAATIDLSGLGLGARTLLLDPVTLVPLGTTLFDAQGACSLPLAIPNDPGLTGGRVCLQVFGAGSSGLVAGNALELLIGN